MGWWQPSRWDGQIPCHPIPGVNVVYVEVPKAGCTSVKLALAPLLGADPPADIHRWFGYTHARNEEELGDWLTGRWAGWFRFTVVRHPVRRFESFYAGIDPDGLGDINAWIAARQDDERWLDIHAVPQRRLTGDPSLYDFVGRLEETRAIEEAIGVATNCDLDLPRANASAAPRRRLTQRSLSALRTIYAADLDAFDYVLQPLATASRGG